MARQKASWPLIRERRNPSGSKAWMVDCGMVGKHRVRFFFKTKNEAEGEAAKLRIKRANEGGSLFGLSVVQRVDAESALKLLEPHGATLTQAAEFYLRNLDVIREPKLIPDAVRELLDAKVKDRRSSRYLQDLRNRLEVFAVEFETRPVHDVSTKEVESWLRALDVAPVTRNNFRRVLGVFFGFSVKQRYALKNPITDVDIATVNVGRPGILTVAEARALLECADPEILPAIAIALFGGLRPESEIFKLDWNAIDLAEGEIDISRSKNTASYRFVKIQSNLVEWLKKFERKIGPVSPSGDAYYWRLRKARAAAAQKLDVEGFDSRGLRDWPSDCMRHTYASHHYGKFKSASETAEQLGHRGNLQMFYRHYRNRVKEADAFAYWAISPA
jgi:integrase/recombinase XerD